MPLPGSVTIVTVTEDYRRADGTAPNGRVTFTPSVRSTVAGTSIVVEPVTVTLTNGQLSVSLAYQGDSDLVPSGWTYKVVESIGHEIRATSVSLPATGPVALHTLAPVDPVVPAEVRVLTVEGIGPDSSGNIDLPPAAGADSAGTAAAGDAAHVAASDPHPQYLTATEGNAAYATVGHTHAISAVTSLQAALDAKAPLASPAFTGTPTGITKAHVGLPNVDNTSDAGKPISTATQAALDGKATKMVVRQAYVTSGNIQLNVGTNTWGPLTGSPTLVIPAVVGDYIDLDVTVLRQANANIFLDVGVLVSAAIVRYMATGSGTPAGEGDPGLYHTALPARSGSRGFAVQAGDLSGGNVTFTFAIRNTSGSSSLLLASTDNPLYWRAVNRGSVS